jgi:hypothetical protein
MNSFAFDGGRKYKTFGRFSSNHGKTYLHELLLITISVLSFFLLLGGAILQQIWLVKNFLKSSSWFRTAVT